MADVPSWATCGVCLEVLLDPRQCAGCTTNVCTPCLQLWYASSRTCPTCRASHAAMPQLNRGLRDAIEAVVPAGQRRAPAAAPPAPRSPRARSGGDGGGLWRRAGQGGRAGGGAGGAGGAGAGGAGAGGPARVPTILANLCPSDLSSLTFELAFFCLATGFFGLGLWLLAIHSAIFFLLKRLPAGVLGGEDWSSDDRPILPWGVRHTLFTLLILLAAWYTAISARTSSAPKGAATPWTDTSNGVGVGLLTALPALFSGALSLLPYARARNARGEVLGGQLVQSMRLAQLGLALLLLGQWRLVLLLGALLEGAVQLRAAVEGTGLAVYQAWAMPGLAFLSFFAILAFLPPTWASPFLVFALLAPLALTFESLEALQARVYGCDVSRSFADIAAGFAFYAAASEVPRAFLLNKLRELRQA